MSKQNILLMAGTSKLGHVFVKPLSELGFNIIFTYYLNEKKRLESTCKNTIGINHNFLKDSSKDLFSKALSLTKNNKINILINNASIFRKSNLDSFTEIIKINSLPSLEFGKMFLKKNLKNSSIINMLDASIAYYHKNYLEYNLSKKLLLEITKILAIGGTPKQVIFVDGGQKINKGSSLYGI